MAAFLGLCICATGITSREEKVIHQLTQELGVVYSPNLTKSVTHLIVKRVGSEKHALAQKQNIFCLEMKWLVDCKSTMSRMNEESYQVLPFTGLNISVSQLEPDERHRITRLVESNGGKFGRNIEKDITTHLICLRPEGDKFNAAKLWKNVKIVNPQWIDDCVRKQMWLDEKDYPVFPSSTSISSTQTTLPASVPSKPTSRLIPIMKRAVAKIRRSITESTQIDHDEISTLHDPETKKEHTANILLENEISQLNDLIPELSLKELEQYLRPHIVPNSLHNEVIFVAGFDDQITLKLVKLISFGSGFRSAILSERITKCILGPAVSERLLHSIVTHPLSPVALTLTWLMETVIPSWRTLLNLLPAAPGGTIPPPPLTGSGSTESEEIQLRENLKNHEDWIPPLSRPQQLDEAPHDPRRDSISPPLGDSVIPTESFHSLTKEDPKLFRDSLADQSEFHVGDEEQDSDREEQTKHFISKKRTRWAGGGRRKKQASQNQTQEMNFSSQCHPSPRVSRNTPSPLSHGRPRASPQVGESQMVVYEADTQPHCESDWL